MKKSTPLFFIALIWACMSFAQPISHEQIVTKRAELYADSIIRAYEYANWDTYLQLSYVGAIKYYGGKAGYMEHVQRAWKKDKDQVEQPLSTYKIIQMENDMDEWQCVVEKKTERLLDNNPSVIISYLIGQSKDDGYNWKYFDVAHNSVANVIYMMPDVFTNLTIPETRIVRR